VGRAPRELSSRRSSGDGLGTPQAFRYKARGQARRGLVRIAEFRAGRVGEQGRTGELGYVDRRAMGVGTPQAFRYKNGARFGGSFSLAEFRVGGTKLSRFSFFREAAREAHDMTRRTIFPTIPLHPRARAFRNVA
jgi:hypothetical protein